MSNRTIEEQIKYYCAYQERSHHEVKKKLYEIGGVDKDEIEELITILIQENYLNEERYARAYTGGKFRVKEWGRQKIIQGLKKQYVSAYCIKKGLEEIDEVQYQKNLLKQFDKKKASLKSDKNKFSRMTKMKAYLIQKGYTYTEINPLLQKI